MLVARRRSWYVITALLSMRVFQPFDNNYSWHIQVAYRKSSPNFWCWHYKLERIQYNITNNTPSIGSIYEPVLNLELNHLIINLQSLIRQSWISARNYDIADCTNFVSNIMRMAGIRCRIYPFVFPHPQDKCESRSLQYVIGTQ